MSACKHYNNNGIYRCEIKLYTCHNCSKFEMSRLEGLTGSEHDPITGDRRTWGETQAHYDTNPDKVSRCDGKADTGKTRMSLYLVQFADHVRSCADVLTFGATKYPKPPLDNSWRDVPQGVKRYEDALYRHLHAAFKGEHLDEESGLPHLAHAAVNIAFLAELLEGEK